MINNVITNEDTYLNATDMPMHVYKTHLLVFIHPHTHTHAEGREANTLVSISGATRILKI